VKPTAARPTVTPRARRREDRAGDPLDGLVNLFDLGIVLALAFLLVALASLERREQRAVDRVAPDAVVVQPGERDRPLPERGARVVGRGERVGSVYRLRDGRLIYVTPKRREAAPP
jgi:hypothetical protein